MPLGMEVRISPGDYVLDGDPAPSTKRGRALYFAPCLLWPNGCMDQDATWYGGMPRPRRHCVRWGPSFEFQKGGGASSLIFGPSIVAKRLDDQDGTWHGGGPWCRPHCARWGPSSPPQKGGRAPSQFLAHVYCGQTAVYIRIPLGTEVSLSLGDIVLDGDPAPLP